ncbi:MAG: septum formation initiator family protein, partial [Coriobacteriales bacterium]|nr:septum formation initiator family protein [Coriobacteriales bacterium]
ARQQEREARRVARARRDSSKSIGADTLAMPGAQARGFVGRNAEKPHGRGETVLAAERARRGTYEVSRVSTASDNVKARPAVYTQETRKKGLLERLGIKKSAEASVRSTKVSSAFSHGSAARAATNASPGYEARPAVYTHEASKRNLFSQKGGLGGTLASRLHLPGLERLPHIPIPVIVAAFIALALVIIYGPARTYYAAWRESGILEAEYQVVAEQNAELNDELARLQSLEGIEDEARKRGYAYPNEEALVVDGVEEEVLADPSLAAAAVAEHEANLPWYVQVLDTVLGYEHR